MGTGIAGRQETSSHLAHPPHRQDVHCSRYHATRASFFLIKNQLTSPFRIFDRSSIDRLSRVRLTLFRREFQNIGNFVSRDCSTNRRTDETRERRRRRKGFRQRSGLGHTHTYITSDIYLRQLLETDIDAIDQHADLQNGAATRRVRL